MSDEIITQESQKSKKLNELLQGLHDLYKDDLKKTIYLCYELGATQEQIASILGTSRENIAMRFPKKNFWICPKHGLFLDKDYKKCPKCNL